MLTLKGAKGNNLKDVTLELPLAGVVCITGVSGSGKSTLLHEILVPAIKTQLFKKDAILYQRENYNHYF